MIYYDKFTDKDLSLTDWLAVERTVLANERNLLAYIRTFLSFSISGIGIIKLFPNIVLVGYVSIIIGFFVLFFGIKKYKHTEEKFNKFKV